MRISDWSSDVCSSNLATLAVPTMIEMLVDESERSGRPIAQIRNITYGASPISEASLLRALAALPNARFAQAYGQTECSPVVTILEHEDHRAGFLRSAGRPIPGVDLRVVDRSEEHTSELQSLMRISYAVFCLKKKNNTQHA